MVGNVTKERDDCFLLVTGPWKKQQLFRFMLLGPEQSNDGSILVNGLWKSNDYFATRYWALKKRTIISLLVTEPLKKVPIISPRVTFPTRNVSIELKITMKLLIHYP